MPCLVEIIKDVNTPETSLFINVGVLAQKLKAIDTSKTLICFLNPLNLESCLETVARTALRGQRYEDIVPHRALAGTSYTDKSQSRGA